MSLLIPSLHKKVNTPAYQHDARAGYVLAALGIITLLGSLSLTLSQCGIPLGPINSISAGFGGLAILGLLAVGGGLVALADQLTRTTLQLKLAKHYAPGKKVDFEKATHWAEKAAESGLPEAQILLAELMYSQRSKYPDIQRVIDLVESAAAKGSARGQLKLATWIMNTGTLCGEENLARIMPLAESAAANGEANAYHIMTLLYGMGFTVERNTAKADGFRIIAAEQGSEYALSALIKRRETTDKDRKRYLASLRAVAKAGSLAAHNFLAELYRDGIGVEKDMDLAKALYRANIAAGNARSCYELARMMGDEDFEEKCRLLELGVERRNTDAMIALADLYENNKISGKGRQDAAALLLEAAELGHPQAQIRVQKTEYGIPTPSREKHAYRLRLAAESGNERAQHFLGCLTEELE